MFGMGFMEIFLVLIIAIIALGPEKLPTAVEDIAKFFKKFKNSIDEAKTSLDNELHIAEMKKQAEEFKASMGDVKSMAQINLNSINSDRVYEDIEDELPAPKTATLPKENKIKKETISLNNEDK